MAELSDREAAGVRILVVDDDADLRRLVRMTLELHGGFAIVGEAADGGSALELAATLRPDVVVLDLGLPDLHGLEVLPEILHLSPNSRIVVFSGLDEHEAETTALAGGAARYVLKGSDVDVLVRALEELPPQIHEAATSFDASPESAAGARRFVRDVCLNWGCEELADSALLVVSELVTNAVTHARTRCTLTIRLRGAVLRLEVTDNSHEAPSPRLLSAYSEGGRGLFIVAALSSSWGIDPASRGKTVWAEFSREAQSLAVTSSA